MAIADRMALRYQTKEMKSHHKWYDTLYLSHARSDNAVENKYNYETEKEMHVTLARELIMSKDKHETK